MNNEEYINWILDNVKGIERDRYIRIEMGKATPEEIKHVFINKMIKLRRIVIQNYKTIEKIVGYKRTHQKNYEYLEKIGDIVRAAETHLKIADINNLIIDCKDSICDCGKWFQYILRQDLLTEHEACQLFNINWKTFQDAKEEYLKMDETNSDHIVYSVIVVMASEYRERKGRMKDWLDCPRYEMPIYWAMHEYMMDATKDNEEFHEAAFKKFKEIFGDIPTYHAVKDLEGNIIEIVKDEEDIND